MVARGYNIPGGLGKAFCVNNSRKVAVRGKDIMVLQCSKYVVPYAHSYVRRNNVVIFPYRVITW